ncbi:hypothetical protein [Streptomyces sp. KN37]|uniref:hypothetical protein n=1 Tax=Streptomyces sp. KN37 TaxID=3090667 RepID=UPI002A756C15|nr:hypothetical protein [Streptomyces sp. KN37]WPO76312.1 hypothetical protein R9806_37190 [Streptomyces sp. KN37]
MSVDPQDPNDGARDFLLLWVAILLMVFFGLLYVLLQHPSLSEPVTAAAAITALVATVAATRR